MEQERNLFDAPPPVLEVAPPTDRPVTLAEISEYFGTTIHLETTTALDHRNFYARLRAHDAQLIAELGKLKKAQIQRMCGYSTRSETKPEMIKSALHNIITDFAIADGGISYSPFQEKYEDAIDRYVAQVTDANLADYRQRCIDSRAKRAADKEKTDQATDNPQTLADFETCIHRRGVKKLIADKTPVPKKQYDVDALVRRTGFAELTDPEVALYDELQAAKGAERRAADMVKKATIKRIEIGDGNYMEVVESWHSKHEVNTWLVVLAEREDRTTFEELCIAARKLSGNYSRAWRGDASSPARPGGFQFWEEAQALKFVELQSRDIFEMSRLERLVARRDFVRDNAIEHFGGLADRMDDRAVDKLAEIDGRKLNTERRIMQAESATDKAHESQAMAGTLRSYATALQQRLAKHTDRIRWRTHAEAFDDILRSARHEVRRVDYPWPRVGAHTLRQIAEDIGDKDGSIMISRRMLKLASDAADHVVVFRGDYADDLRHFYRRARLHRTNRWALDGVRESMGNFKRLRLMGIDTLPELRAALREHLGHRVANAEMTRAEKVMLDLYPGQFPPDYFPTPIDVVGLMLEYADIEDGMSILEPSAGSGHIANELRSRFPSSSIGVVEISGLLCRTLAAQDWRPVQADFLTWAPSTGPQQLDRIVMNPPFGCDGVGTDINHVKHAFELLAPGGRLVSLMSDGVFYRGDAKAQEFRAWLESLDGMDFELPEGAFLNGDRPTSWAARVVVITKPS